MHESCASNKGARAVQTKDVSGRPLFKLAHFGNQQLLNFARVNSICNCKCPQGRNRRLFGSVSGG